MPYIVRNQIKYATGSGSGGGNTNSVDLTMAEYEALEAQGKVSEDTTYYITDASVEGMFSSGIVKLTQAEYDALPESKYSDGVLYAITDGESSDSVGKPVELTREQYEALGDSVLNDNILYAITDGDGLSAKNLAFDDSETQLGVNNVQDAIVEQNKKLDKEWSHVVVSAVNTKIELDLSKVEYIGIGGIVTNTGAQEIDNVTILPVSVWLDMNLKLQCFSHNGSQMFLAYVEKVSDTLVNVAFNHFNSALLIYK